jgi:hypothetical protein
MKQTVSKEAVQEKWLLGCACIFSEGLPKHKLRRYHTRKTAFWVAFSIKNGVGN